MKNIKFELKATRLATEREVASPWEVADGFAFRVILKCQGQIAPLMAGLQCAGQVAFSQPSWDVKVRYVFTIVNKRKEQDMVRTGDAVLSNLTTDTSELFLELWRDIQDNKAGFVVNDYLRCSLDLFINDEPDVIVASRGRPSRDHDEISYAAYRSLRLPERKQVMTQKFMEPSPGTIRMNFPPTSQGKMIVSFGDSTTPSTRLSSRPAPSDFQWPAGDYPETRQSVESVSTGQLPFSLGVDNSAGPSRDSECEGMVTKLKDLSVVEGLDPTDWTETPCGELAESIECNPISQTGSCANDGYVDSCLPLSVSGDPTDKSYPQNLPSLSRPAIVQFNEDRVEMDSDKFFGDASDASSEATSFSYQSGDESSQELPTSPASNEEMAVWSGKGYALENSDDDMDPLPGPKLSNSAVQERGPDEVTECCYSYDEINSRQSRGESRDIMSGGSVTQAAEPNLCRDGEVYSVDSAPETRDETHPPQQLEPSWFRSPGVVESEWQRPHISATKRKVIIDGSNVAYDHGCGNSYSARGILLALEYFEQRQHDTVAIVNRRHSQITGGPRQRPGHDADVALLDELRRQGRLCYCPVDEDEDLYILQYAARNDALILSNDWYRKEVKSQLTAMNRARLADLISRNRISYMFIRDQLFVKPNIGSLWVDERTAFGRG
uniref:RNase NYN domain-containing protein n=1 Tax=Compsopogon caeruleus TaxID=31354 RepID=A0A7S1TE81_9RHOD|mmetsp:Transcript_3035/g.5829  ORF Transcript_3035/g.5829 Transcript_3035/m.5829 type:complete len:666 (+) Transcript_3035:115-2112(+)